MDIFKYNKIQLHSNASINKRISVLFLYYDKKCEERKLLYKERIKLINIFIESLVKYEEYELAEAFKIRKFRKAKKWRSDRRDYTPYYMYRFIKSKISKIWRSIF